MAQEPSVAAADEGVAIVDQQPSSPTGSTSSREETRAAREKLKKTSIAGLSQKSNNIDLHPSDDPLAKSDASIQDIGTEAANGIRGRPAKKRSFEDLAKDEAETDTLGAVGQPPLPKSGHHKRMRSRDINSGDHQQAYAKMEGDLKNTLHEETDSDAQTAPGGPGVLVDAPTREEMEADAAQQASNAPSQPATKIPPSSGFANSSSMSPFGSTNTSLKEKSPDPSTATSTSAFASSGLSAFASSEKSPFGAAAGSKSPLGGGFGGGNPAATFGPAKSGFASTGGFSSSGTSPFGGSSNVFGPAKGFGNTSSFGAPKPFGAVSTFGSGPSTFGPSKPFGSAKREDEDDGDEDGNTDGDEEASNSAKDDAQQEQDPRFHQQQSKSCLCIIQNCLTKSFIVETGEDGEDVHFSSRARLYFFDGAWKERGTGTFKINIRMTDSDTTSQADVEAQSSTGRRKARLLMRADATHRVLLNSPIFKGMRFGGPSGEEPIGKVMHLQSLEEGKPVPLQLKVFFLLLCRNYY